MGQRGAGPRHAAAGAALLLCAGGQQGKMISWSVLPVNQDTIRQDDPGSPAAAASHTHLRARVEHWKPFGHGRQAAAARVGAKVPGALRRARGRGQRARSSAAASVTGAPAGVLPGSSYYMR